MSVASINRSHNFDQVMSLGLGPVLYLSTKAKMTLTIGLALMFHEWGATPWNLVMAGSVVMVLPILIIYILGQKYFVQGIVTTGLKF